MRESRNGVTLALKWTLLLCGGLIWLGGCDSSQSGSTKPVYKSPEEVDKAKADLHDAMKGGAYGSAGRAAAPQLDPTKR